VATTTARGNVNAGDRTPAQWYALLVGAVLVLVGLAGFLAEPGFGTGDDVDRGSLLGFDVNGWHNLVHLASGAFLLAFAGRADTARMAVLAFATIYLIVTIWGFIVGDGGEILGLIPINTPDNILHIALTLVAFAAAFASPTHTAGPTGRGTGRTTGDAGRTTGGSDDAAAVSGDRFQRESGSTVSPSGDRPAR
jgi:hypothetical protein